MITVYITLIGILFLLAISDLVVGVSNDAVNFLSSAIGSKAAPFKIIMVVAAVGVLVGAVFSGGMMEIARKGIFNPQLFYFSEVILIFLAVMITDVILLDLFNTFGLPTSTTVSLIFELLGASVAIAVVKIYSTHENTQNLGDFINSAKALAIVSGILVSVVIAFTIGALVQYITRIIFSFNYKKRLNYYGGLWGGFAITAITYFMLIKGAKGATFMSEASLYFIQHHTWVILATSFIFWTLLLQLLYWLFKFNILKLIVLVGTFALAMAFAGNDLVNFIGVPLAGYESLKEFLAHPDAQADMFLMTSLQAKVQTPTLFLLFAGLIMVLTLWISKKARSVTKTTLNLSRQDEGAERFGSTVLSRALVRGSLQIGSLVESIVPHKLHQKIQKQFEPYEPTIKTPIKDIPSFDMLRASVNLVVSSILIASGTSLKLPLSTTYVTFMVAMGTSLSDNAWGRESAVYRITGVLSVIGGWFFTAISAFTASFILAMIFSYLGIFGVGMMCIIAIIILYRTHLFHKGRIDVEEQVEKAIPITEKNIIQQCNNTVSSTIANINTLYQSIIESIINEDLKQIKIISAEVKTLTNETKDLKNNLTHVINKLHEDSFETAHYYVQVLDYLRELAHNISFISKPCLEHIDNNHKKLIDIQIEELNYLRQKIGEFLTIIEVVIREKEYIRVEQLIGLQQELLQIIAVDNKKQIKRIKRLEVGTKNSLLYLSILSESKNLLLNSISLLKSQRDFTISDERSIR